MEKLINEMKQLKISNETATLLASVRQAEAICGTVSDVLSSVYGDHMVDEKMNQGFTDAFYAMTRAIHGLIGEVIEERMYSLDVKEI